jgi:hypothetical protein
MAIFNTLHRFCNKPVFDSQHKMPVHKLQILLIIIAIGLTVPRLFIRNPPPTRAATLALAMVHIKILLKADPSIHNPGYLHSTNEAYIGR